MHDSNDTIKAAAWMMGGVFSFIAMAVAGREIYVELDTFELMLYRSIVGLFILTPILLRSKLGPSQVINIRLSSHFIRNLIHFTGQNLWFFAIATIPLAQLVSLEFTNPIWVAILAPFLLGEALTKPRIVAAILGFAGILIVARPGSGALELGHFAALGAALLFALTNITTKRIMRRDSVLSLLFWMTVMQMGMGLISAAPNGIAVPSLSLLPWLALLSITALTAHLCLTTALKLAPATIVGPMEFLRLPLISVVGMLMYGEPLEIAVFIGAVLIISGNFVNLYAERQRQKARL